MEAEVLAATSLLAESISLKQALQFCSGVQAGPRRWQLSGDETLPEFGFSQAFFRDWAQGEQSIYAPAFCGAKKR